ncbi:MULTISPECIES: cytochrome P450 [Pseudonocardia]|uniref:Cytochrome P450 107B1 n=2 Tax=Pseudonocardia TaxID=1847 RepID=A0A1Y2N034_PSEAH|nr:MULTISPECIES: cytochrome P450 [Pseudonocardia]OSY40780.1 Cytochrome P450 107B1 [Pseudonocardia autotrophica]TDN71913.1 cytochrome P450 [Pseudonocardia autotrophica]BBG02601.1 cytochrome P450 [Pseudonocardia autotrophica]GEC24660.1 cytochrome P450 [Pseudonocardia saturnea]
MPQTHRGPDLQDVVRLDDPAFFLADPGPVYQRMHEEAPVLWLPRVNAFAVSRHADVQDVSRRANVFSTADGIMLNDAKFGRNTAVDFFPPDSELIVTTDPPRHHELRRVIQPAFAPAVIAGLEPRIRAFAREIVSAIEPGREIDFLESVAVPLPIRVVAMVLGLDDVDIATIRQWTDEMVKMGAPVGGSAELDAVRPGLVPLRDYVYEALAERRTRPTGTPDLLSVLVDASLDQEAISDLNVLAMAMAVLVAGNETTRNLMSCTAWALARHPAELEQVCQEPSLIAGAVHESLRWMSPVIAHSRRATAGTVLHDVEIGAGQYVHLLYAAANHDASVFPDPHTFDVRRSTRNRSMAFGAGTHMCPGSSLARLETQILLEELLERFSGWEVAGEPVRNPSVLHNGFLALPLRFH